MNFKIVNNSDKPLAVYTDSDSVSLPYGEEATFVDKRLLDKALEERDEARKLAEKYRDADYDLACELWERDFATTCQEDKQKLPWEGE